MISRILPQLLMLLTLLLPCTAGAVAVKDVQNVHVADRTRYVTDMAGMLSPAAIARTDSILAGVWRASSAEPVVVIVDNLDGEDIDDYVTELFDLWHPGKKDNDNGVIMLISLEDRRFVIRTGYGAEGVLPDALCWEILNNELTPRFREGDYDGGVIAATTAMSRALSSPEAREELMSKYSNDAGARADDGINTRNLVTIWLCFGAGLTLVFLIYLITVYANTKKKPTAERYHELEKGRLPLMVFTALTLGLLLPMLAVWLMVMHRTRNRPRVCSNCGATMKKLDEQTDNLYLTPAQDAEERLDSVDYDVWLCPQCNQTEVIPYVNKRRNYTDCPVCGARTCALVSSRILRQPTTDAPGQGLRTYSCYNCHNRRQVPYQIPKLVAPPIIISGGFGGGHGGGGGFSGGSFGGGMTGGGGASGGW